MKCPKCQYIGFDNGDRCRNCGYEFSLTADTDAEPLDLPIQTGDEALGPLEDFALSERDMRLPRAPGRDARSDYVPPNGGFPLRGPLPPPRAPTPVRVPPATADSPAGRRPATGPLELPLFNDRAFDDDRPLVTPPAVPRAPLSVRRSGPPPPRAQGRTPADEPQLDLETAAAAPRSGARQPPAEPTAIEAAEAGTAAPAARRLLAAIVDLLLLASIDAGVLYLTLQLLDFRVSELPLLPRAPLAGFLLLLNGGYCVAFTAAGGQTIGKMLTGIRVVPADDGMGSDRVPLGNAALRTAAYLVSALPAGLGYLPALISADRRALHDRLADTRVVLA